MEEALSLNRETFVPVWMQNRLNRVPTLLLCARPRAKGERPLVALGEAAADWCSGALQDVKGASSLASRTCSLRKTRQMGMRHGMTVKEGQGESIVEGKGKREDFQHRRSERFVTVNRKVRGGCW